MKYILTQIILCSFISVLSAQIPEIDINWFPEDGEDYVEQKAFTHLVEPGSSGAQQVWDYSHLVDSSDEKVTSYVSADLTQFYSDFPDSEIASIEGGTEYDYFDITNNKISYLGSETPNFSIHLTDPELIYEMPFTYQDQFLDSLSGTLFFGAFEFDYNGTSHFEVDGYGSLILPDGRQFDSVLRFKWIEITIAADDMQNPVFESTLERYVWVSPECPQPLLSISYFSQLSGGSEFASKSVLYSKGVFTAVDDFAEVMPDISVFPNPARNILSIKKESTADFFGSLYDLHGRLYLQFNGENDVEEIDVSHLPGGSYILRLQSATGVVSRKILIL